MSDAFLEIVRAIIVSVIFFYLLLSGKREEIHRQRGWSYVVTGFALLLFGMIIDITDNFPGLNRFIIIGDTEYQSFLEKAVGYLCGFLFLAVGFWKLIPTVITLSKTESALKKSRDELELRVSLRTSALVEINNELESEIAERYRAEKELEHREEYWRSLIENVMDIITVLDINGIINYLSPSIEKVLGYKPEELAGTNVIDFVHPGDKAIASEALVRIATIPGHSESIEVRYRHKNESWITLEVIGKNLSRESRVSGIILNSRDITGRRQAEELLHQSRHEWEDTFNSITDMITIHDKDFNIIRSNKAAKKILKLPVLNTSKVKCFKYYHGTDSPPEYCSGSDCLKKVKPSAFEMFEPNLNMFIEIMAIPRFDSNNKLSGLIHVVRDITERRQMEEDLMKVKNLESLGILAGGIAHDFNNLLQSIMGNISFAKMPLKSGDKIYKLLEISEQACEQAISLTNRLIIFSKGGRPVKKTIFLGKLVRDATDIILRDSNIKSEFKMPDNLWPVEADERQMIRVIQNLILNARDAMTEGGTINVTAENAAVTDNDGLSLINGKYIKLTIEDQGIGITGENLAKIFDPYFTTRKMGEEKGAGLGLSVCYAIIKIHGGLITVESKINIGTIFFIYLPVADKEAVT